MSEGGIGWIPYFLERPDYVYKHHKAWTGMDLGGRLPVGAVPRAHHHLLHRRRRRRSPNRDRLNIDNITWECDYPHSDSTWPHAPERL